MLMTATAHMTYIMDLKGPVNEEENAYAKGMMEQIRDAQIQSLRTALAMGKEYADAKRAFEEAYSKFGLYDSQAQVISDDRLVNDIGRYKISTNQGPKFESTLIVSLDDPASNLHA